MKSINKKIIYLVSIFILFSNIIVKASECLDKNQLYEINTKRDLLALMMAYPEYIIDIEKDKDDFIYLIMKSGKKIIYDDKVEKTMEEKYSNPDLHDMLEEAYPLERIDKVLEENKDPGRIRVYSLLNEVYGSGESNISKNLLNTNTQYGTFQFNKQNNASENLKGALNKIYSKSKDNSALWNYVAPINGTYNYRMIQGTGRLSAHAYGIAIDLNRNNNDYWKWVSKEAGSNRIKNYPNDIITTFEDEGFIWGGKWSHFDILHFEYRPEFILKAKYFNNMKNNNIVNWYDGVEINEKTQEVINFIDKKLQ